MKALRQADLEALRRVVPAAVAQAVYDSFHGNGEREASEDHHRLSPGAAAEGTGEL